MDVEVNLNNHKTLYKIELWFLKVIPMLMALNTLGNSILSYFDIDLKKLSESHKGIKQSEETRLKRSKAMLEKGGKPVILYDESGKIIKEFNSASECERYLGLKRGAVSSSIANNRKNIKKIYKVCYKYD